MSHLESFSASKGFILEAVLTLLLVFVVLNAAHKHFLIGTQAAVGGRGHDRRVRDARRRADHCVDEPGSIARPGNRCG